MGWSRFVAVVALTTRQRLKEHSSSSPRKAIRPLVVKQTEYPERERTARCGKSSKVVILSFRAILVFGLVGFFPHRMQVIFFFTFQGDSTRSFSSLFALAGKSQHSEVNQVAKARHSVWQHCPQSHQCHVWPLEQRVQGHLEGKATLELPLALKVRGEGQLFML